MTSFNDLPVKTVTVPQGTIAYREVGQGSTLLFVHGLLVNGQLWRKVVPLLASQYHCVIPDLPLGAHQHVIAGDTSPQAVAKIIAAFMDALNLQNVTLVGNDTGGAICQMVITQYPQRIGRLVLTNCDAFEHFLPVPANLFQVLPYIPGLMRLFAFSMRSSLLQWLLVALLARRTPEASVRASYFRPMQTQPGIFANLAVTLRTISKRDTLAAATLFPKVSQPVLLAWGKDDWIFRPIFAKRLATAFAHAQVTFIPGSRTFVPEDQPRVLSQLVADFANDVTHTVPST